MRPLLHGDISAAARALYGAPAADRPALSLRLIAEAEIADAHARDLGRIHPTYGNGSLMGAARKRALPPEPGFSDPEYCLCFAQILRAVASHAPGNFQSSRADFFERNRRPPVRSGHWPEGRDTRDGRGSPDPAPVAE